MPITISRTGDIHPITSPLTQEQKDAAWEAIIRTWAKKHPDQIKEIFKTEDAS